jgi:hypothetical protein
MTVEYSSESALTGVDRRPSVGILWREAATSPLYQAWLADPPADLHVRVIPDYEALQELPADLDLVVTHNHYRWDELAVLRRAMLSQNIGVLVLADGIAEFRNTWRNPAIPAGSLMQPAIAHKIATIGPAQTRLFEAWGNQGKCETVGLPRLDGRAQQFGWFDDRAAAGRGQPASHPSSLLICSARTPAFSEQQWVTALDQFRRLHQYLQTTPLTVAGAPVQVRWRVADRIRESLGLADTDLSVGEVAEAIDEAWAVITTPSTLQLEAMLAGRPVAVLDFFNVPLYLPAAWHITAAEQLFSVIPAILAPVDDLLSYQVEIVRDQLWCSSPATPRMWQLIRSMASIAQRQRDQHQPVRFPARLLSDREQVPEAVPNWLDLHPQRQRLAAEALAKQTTWWELTEVDAALIRAREYSEERRQLHYMTETHRQSVIRYEQSVKEQADFIEYQKKCLEDVAQRHGELSERFNERNQVCDQQQHKILQLAEEKRKAHEMLTEAYADAKRKQERVNELRIQNEQLREEANQLRQAHRRLREQLTALQEAKPGEA